ncbi:MAG: tryptophan--tRNA ligase [Rickettsiaceae bacterium]|nr:tryptophan--tRNA ligase [Rickettsiaceae bacterium]
MKKIAFSGSQTSGILHLGNYLGAIKNWLYLQENYDCYFFLANLHAITINQDPVALRNATYDMAAIYLAAGISPEKSTLFIQSTIPEHAELTWMLSCITPIGWLKRMTQFKDKAGKSQDNASTGLFTYPILMAADILLYKPDIVPVGDDQKQHLELTRDIAGVINRKFNREIFKLPEPFIQGPSTRVMSLRDGTKKMSKSDDSDASRINLIDEPDLIAKKIIKSKTDSFDYLSYEPETRPEITNLINIFSSLTNLSVEEILKQYQNSLFSTFKKDLADIIINHLAPLQHEYKQLLQDKSYIEKILSQGTNKAREKAAITCNELKGEFGLIV